MPDIQQAFNQPSERPHEENVPLSTPLDIWWIPSWTNPGAENAELILLNKVLFTRKLSDFSFSFRIFWILPVVFLVCKPYDPWTNRHLFSSKSLDFFWVHSTWPMTSSPIVLYSLTPVQPHWTAFYILNTLGTLPSRPLGSFCWEHSSPRSPHNSPPHLLQVCVLTSFSQWGLLWWPLSTPYPLSFVYFTQ